MLGDVALVFRCIRVFVGTQEQHVLQKVCQATPSRRVVTRANHHVEGRGGLGGIGRRHEQDLKVIVQGEKAVLIIIVGALNRGYARLWLSRTGHHKNGDTQGEQGSWAPPKIQRRH